MKIKLDENMPSVLVLRQPGRNALRNRVLQLFQSEAVDTWARSVVIATDTKLRVRAATRRP